MALCFWWKHWALYHQTTEGFGLEGTFTDHPVQSPAMDRDIFCGSGCSMPCLAWPWTLPEMRHHSCPGQPVLVSHHPHCKPFLPYAQSNTPVFQLKTIIPGPVTIGPSKKSLSVFLLSTFYILKGCSKVSLQPFLSQISQPFFVGSFVYIVRVCLACEH